ncbi:MAG: DegV family protein [Lachnospiraceae bacterium]|nr:DegV family protein [Lachnospiraceae bacterium]
MSKKIAVVTDSNSGITQAEGKQLGIFVLPMPFYIDGGEYFEDINLSQDEFYTKLSEGADIMTSQPTPPNVLNLWKEVLEEYDELVHIPMSSGLSGSCESAYMLSHDFEGRVQVINNQRISVTQRQSCLDAMALAEKGYDAAQIKDILEREKYSSSIYIMLDTLHYLKKGGRITPAAAAIGTLLKIKPVLTIQGEKLDAFSKARTSQQGRNTMITAIKKDIDERFGGYNGGKDIFIEIAYTYDLESANSFKAEVQAAFPESEIVMDPLSLSVSCHIGPGALAVACCKKLPELA